MYGMFDSYAISLTSAFTWLVNALVPFNIILLSIIVVSKDPNYITVLNIETVSMVTRHNPIFV